jgi:hypothetical protein
VTVDTYTKIGKFKKEIHIGNLEAYVVGFINANFKKVPDSC